MPNRINCCVQIDDSLNRFKMIRKNSQGLTVLLIVLCVSSCGGTPYVEVANEHNRGSSEFLYGITERKDVVICHSNFRTTSKLITELAHTECQRFGKIAQFRNTTLNRCPLLMPVAAIFDCTFPAQSKVFR